MNPTNSGQGNGTTSHSFTDDLDYKLYRPGPDELQEGIIAVASGVRTAYPDKSPAQRLAIFQELANYLALPTDKTTLAGVQHALKARRTARQN